METQQETSVQAQQETTAEKKPRGLRQSVQGFVFAALLLGALFGSAGTVRWVQGWIYVALWMIGMIGGGMTIRRCNPSLLRERAKWRRSDTKPFDKVFLAIYLPLMYVQLAVGGLDARRFHWARLPFGWTCVGVALFMVATVVIMWALAINPHAESTVRIQKDRGHSVVSSGPYRIVRHPMYFGLILMYMATALVLGSGWAMAVGGAIALLYLWRTIMEDRTLRSELQGYEEYATRTKYRLVPGIW